MSSLNSGMFSSASDEWGTPQWLFDYYNRLHAFTLDVCASADNAKVSRFFDAECDGLKQDWSADRCWMNPPYGRSISEWMAKAHEESRRGALVVCLVPARTDTAWWHDFAQPHVVTFLRGRLSFDACSGQSNPSSAPFPSAVVTMTPPIVRPGSGVTQRVRQ